MRISIFFNFNHENFPLVSMMKIITLSFYGAIFKEKVIIIHIREIA